MVRNVNLKKMLKRFVFPCFSLVNKILPKRDDYILLYSANHGIGSNLLPLYEYLLKHGYDRKYKIICGIESMSYALDENRVAFVNHLRSLLYFLRSRHIYYATGQIPIRPSKNQLVIQVDHGATNFKSVGYLSQINNGEMNYFTLYTAPAEIYRSIAVKAYRCSPSSIVINGEPELDVFFEDTETYDLGKFNKVGIWMPTFRQSDYLGYDDSSEQLLPMFEPEDYEELNERLQKRDIKLIVKIHPAQTLTDYQKCEYSHLCILSHEDFQRKGYQLYIMLKQMDFLIADYSTVFLESLLLDKPIGFVVPDMEEYAQRRGFCFENPLDFMPGEIIKTKEELYHFLDDMASGKDRYSEDRKKVCNLVHTYHDNGNTKRALQFGGITPPEN